MNDDWFSRRTTCLRYLAHVIGSPGDWHMAPTLANGQPAAIARYRDSAYGLGVLTVTLAGHRPHTPSSAAAPTWRLSSAFRPSSRDSTGQARSG